MRNIWLVFRRDVSNLFRNVMSVIITIGLVLMPSLFSWYNILACWNVFENTGNLSIAVANEDEGYTSDLMPININIGEKVVSALRANDQINWVVTSGDDAIEGTKSGEYYAALVIPEGFSRQMLTFYEGDSHSADIHYYVNEKVNAISPNITGAGASTVSAQVNETFAQTLSEVAAGLAKTLSESVQDEDMDGRLAILTEHMRSASTRIDETADVLGLYSSLSDDSRELLASSVGLVETARSQAKSAISTADSSKQAIRNLASRLESSIDGVSQSFNKNKTMLASLESKISAILEDASSDAKTAARKIDKRADRVDSLVDKLSLCLDTLEKLRDDLESAIGAGINVKASNSRTESDIRKDIAEAIENIVLLDKCIGDLSKAIDVLEKTSADMRKAADDLESGTADIQEKAYALSRAVKGAQADISSMKGDFDKNLKPALNSLRSDLENLASDLNSTSSKLGSLGSDLPSITAAVERSLDEASGKVDDACAKLRGAADNIRDLADAVDAAATSGDTEKIRSLLAGNVDDLATALTAPVAIDREALFPVENFGSAMAPLYCALALFVGALLIMVAMKPEVSPRGVAVLRDPKPRHLYFGRFGAVSLVSLMQTTLLGLGNMFFLKVQVSDPLLYMACFWISGLVLAFIVYTLVVAFGNLGKAIAVLLLIVQVTGCGGSFPLQVLPDFVQTISPYLPATHVVNGMRAAMFGVYQNDFWISMGCLLLFVVPFLLLGLVLRKPLERFMRFYVEKVEESGIMG